MTEEKRQQEPIPAPGIQRPSPDRKGRIAKQILRELHQVRSELRESRPSSADAIQALGYTEEVAGLVQLLAARTNDPKREVLRKALVLYGLALDAKEKGNRLAILTPDDVIIHDIVGFEADAMAHR